MPACLLSPHELAWQHVITVVITVTVERDVLLIFYQPLLILTRVLSVVVVALVKAVNRDATLSLIINHHFFWTVHVPVSSC